MSIQKLAVIAAAANLFDCANSPLIQCEIEVPRKCRLPGCDQQTSHNGGYCCADHCKRHRIEIKEGE